MVSYYPKEMQELFKFIEPYMEKCHLRDDAPKEAYEALEKLKEMSLELGQQTLIMYPNFPDEIQELLDHLKPYMEKCRLRKDAPKEAYEALEKLKELALYVGQ